MGREYIQSGRSTIVVDREDERDKKKIETLVKSGKMKEKQDD